MPQDVMKEEAENIVAELGLLELLSRYGEARILGSVALDLIVKPDLDVHLLIQSSDLWTISSSICGQLLDHRKLSEIRISDHRERESLSMRC